jgi:hypothetical protein
MKTPSKEEIQAIIEGYSHFREEMANLEIMVEEIVWKLHDYRMWNIGKRYHHVGNIEFIEPYESEVGFEAYIIDTYENERVRYVWVPLSFLFDNSWEETEKQKYQEKLRQQEEEKLHVRKPPN